MPMLSFTVFASLLVFAAAGCSPGSVAAKSKTYCGKFEVNSVPVKIKLIFGEDGTTDIYGSVYGFDMYCTKSPFAICAEETNKGYLLDLDPQDQKEDNCLRKQFEGVDEHMSALQVFYKEDTDKLQLVSSAMEHTFLEPSESCDKGDYKFTIMDEEGNTITARRLTLKDVLATRNTAQPLHV